MLLKTGAIFGNSSKQIDRSLAARRLFLGGGPDASRFRMTNVLSLDVPLCGVGSGDFSQS